MTLGTGNYLTVGLLVSFPLRYGNVVYSIIAANIFRILYYKSHTALASHLMFVYFDNR